MGGLGVVIGFRSFRSIDTQRAWEALSAWGRQIVPTPGAWRIDSDEVGAVRFRPADTQA